MANKKARKSIFLVTQLFFTNKKDAKEQLEWRLKRLRSRGISWLDRSSTNQAVDPTCPRIHEKETHDPMEDLWATNLLQGLNGLGWVEIDPLTKPQSYHVESLFTVFFNQAFLGKLSPQCDDSPRMWVLKFLKIAKTALYLCLFPQNSPYNSI